MRTALTRCVGWAEIAVFLLAMAPFLAVAVLVTLLPNPAAEPEPRGPRRSARRVRAMTAIWVCLILGACWFAAAMIGHAHRGR